MATSKSHGGTKGGKGHGRRSGTGGGKGRGPRRYGGSKKGGSKGSGNKR